jgi:hypothetical protein
MAAENAANPAAPKTTALGPSRHIRKLINVKRKVTFD